MSKELIEYAKSLWKDNDGDSAMQMLIDYLRTKDFVEVVRCKECLHLYTTECPCSHLHPIKGEPGYYSVEYPDGEFFCKRGEKVTK